MPEIPVIQFNHDEQYPPAQPAGYEDMLFAPQIPEKVIEEEKTPEQLRLEHFHGEALTYRENYGAENSMRYALGMDDVCRFEGWPRRHTVVGRHCPHGMLELLRSEDAEEE